MSVSDWIVSLRPPAPTRMRVVCFPNAGSGMATFVPWSRHLPAGTGLGVAQLPGRDRRLREPLCSSIADAAEALSAALLRESSADPVVGSASLVLFGHSLGALIAFETARRLQAAGLAPAAVVLSGRRAASLPEPLPPIAHLPVDEFLDRVQERYGGVPAVVRDEPELRDLLVPTLRGDVALVEQYEYRPSAPLTCPVYAYGGVSDPHATRDELQAWARECVAFGRVRMFPGGHFYLQDHPDAVVRTLIADAGAAAGGASGAPGAARAVTGP
ncbi:MAG: alpha/beta fold hydrolase [Vicinamibacterales bacterium]